MQSGGGFSIIVFRLSAYVLLFQLYNKKQK